MPRFRILIYCSLLFFLFSCKIKVPIRTICIITAEKKSGPHGGEPFHYGYRVNNRIYDEMGYNDPRVLYGEKFEMVYDSLHPKRAQIHTWKPLFLKTDSVYFTTGIIIYVSSHNKRWTEVDFSYTIEEIHYYKKHQLLEGNIPVKKGDCFKVYYLEDDPRLSIINIKEPCTKEK